MPENTPRPIHNRIVERIGNLLIAGLHNAMLFIIAIATIWSAFGEFVHILQGGAAPTLKDILLLFIYLEVLAMVGIYFRTHRLPVRFLVYIAITALTRVLVVDVKTMTIEQIIVFAGAILVLTLSVLILKFGSSRYPSHPPID